MLPLLSVAYLLFGVTYAFTPYSPNHHAREDVMRRAMVTEVFSLAASTFERHRETAASAAANTLNQARDMNCPAFRKRPELFPTFADTTRRPVPQAVQQQFEAPSFQTTGGEPQPHLRASEYVPRPYNIISAAVEYGAAKAGQIQGMFFGSPLPENWVD